MCLKFFLLAILFWLLHDLIYKKNYQVSVSNFTSGVINKPVYFSIDASHAGAGNLEIIVSVNGKNVPNYVQVKKLLQLIIYSINLIIIFKLEKDPLYWLWSNEWVICTLDFLNHICDVELTAMPNLTFC